VDVLVATDKPQVVHKAFVQTPGVEQVLASGESKSSVRVRAGLEGGAWAPEAKGAPLVQVDLRTLPPVSWGAGLMYFTGSKEHNVRLRERALKRGLTLNEYGLYPEDEDETPPQHRGVKPRASRTEEEVYAALGLPWIPPEIREDRGELALKKTPRLVEVADIRAELHAHTTESDGSMTLEELVRQARSRGFHTIGVTDHSRSSVQANGLSVDRLRAQRVRVAELAERTKGIRVLCGSEVDIHPDGRLDYEDETLAELDIVIASPHSSLTQDAKKATKRLVRAIEHPLVHVLGHPTGRLINRRRGLEPDMGEIVAAAKEHNVALEINAHWLRLDLRDSHVRMAVESGCLIAINCDVHAPVDLDHLRYGVLTGRRGWLTPDLCVNAWSAAKLAKWLASKR
jgi:DNA polymerase (family 10)